MFGKFGDLINQNDGELNNGIYNGSTSYSFNTSMISGHGMMEYISIDSVNGFLGSEKINVIWRLFCNGECTPGSSGMSGASKTVDIYAHLGVAYRTVNGEQFDGLEDMYHKTSVYNHGAKPSSITVRIQHETPDIAGYRFVGYKIHEGSVEPGGAIGNDRSGLTTLSPGANQTVSIPMRFTHQEINKSITFYYEKVNLTVRHYNMTDGTKTSNGLRQITTNGNLTKTVTFNRDPAGTVPKHTSYPDYPTNSLSKFWWPAYNLEYAMLSTNSNPDLDANSFRKITFRPYKVFAPKEIDPAKCESLVSASTSIKDAINKIYGISDTNIIIDAIDRMINDSDRQKNAKERLASAANILVYARVKGADLTENDGTINKSEVDMATTKLVTVLEDLLLNDPDKAAQIKKTLKVLYAPSNEKIGEFPAYRADKYINYYYTTTEIMVNNINLETGAYMQSSPDNANVTHNLRTKVPIRDTVFRAESLITTPPAIEGFKYTYSVYDPTTNTYTRRNYDISGFILEKFDIKVGDEVLLEVTKEEAEKWYLLDGGEVALYPPFTDQYIIDTSSTDGVAALVSGAISQIDLSRLDKDASVNFYYKDVSLLKIKYIRDTDHAEIYPGKTMILGPNPVDISPEDLTPNYEYVSYILDGTNGNITPVSVAELPNGQDRELIFVYTVPQLEIAKPENEKYYVDLRSNDRVPANQIKQEIYPDAPARLTEGKYSTTYKSLEEYNTYNDQERMTDQSNEGIPTLEDIYANVVSNQFLMDNALTMQPTTQKLKLTIVKKYYETNTKDDGTTGGSNAESQIGDKVNIKTVSLGEMALPYQYYGASGADLKIIENAIVYNNVIIENGKGVNQTELVPVYQKPYMNYIKNGYLHLPVNRNYESAISGMTDYRGLASGFYNVVNPNNRNEVLEAVWVLDGIDEYEPRTEDLKREYQDANGLILTALQNAGTLVKPDKLSVTYNASPNGQDTAYIREHKVVTDQFNLTSTGEVDVNNNMRLGRTYTADALEKMKVLHTEDIPLVGTDVMYKNTNLYVESKTTNGTQGTSEIEKFRGTDYEDKTVAEVKYILYQTIKNEEVVGGPAATSLQTALGAEYQSRYNDAIRIQTIIGYPVVVHTPVLNSSEYVLGGADDYSEANKHTVNEIKGKNGTLVLGQKFDIKIPHKGKHIDAVGYGNNTYNYGGLTANGNRSAKDNSLFGTKLEEFAMIKQIKFDKVGVILYTKDASGNIGGGNYYPKNTWIDLPKAEEVYTFTIPEWEEEIWDGADREVIIETRVAAENIPDYTNKDYYVSYDFVKSTPDNSYNREKKHYGVWKKFAFKVIGELKDLEIRATNDPGYSGYKTNGTSSMPIGQKGQGNGGAAYQYGIKLGYSVYFDIMSTGWTGDTTESVEISPTFYYVGKNGGQAEKVDLYYKVTGNPNYVKLEGAGARKLTTTMSTDAVKGPRCKSVYALWANRVFGAGSGFFNANAGQEMANTTNLISALKAEILKEGNSNYVKTKNKPTVNYGLPIGTGTTNAIKLPYSVRLAYTNAVNAMLSQKYAGVTGLEVVSNNAKNYCIGHWYGAYKLPATTVVVDPGVTPKPDKSNTKKNGYIIVVFENVHSNKGIPGTDEKDYLKTDPDQYKSQGANIKNNYPFDLPNGKPANVPNPQPGVPEPNYIPAIIYETDIAANQDAEIAGTH